MLMAHPVVLARTLAQYEAMRDLHAEHGGAAAKQRLDDLAYSLCIATGTSDIDAAVIAARYHLPGAQPQDDSALAGEPVAGDPVLAGGPAVADESALAA